MTRDYIAQADTAAKRRFEGSSARKCVGSGAGSRGVHRSSDAESQLGGAREVLRPEMRRTGPSGLSPDRGPAGSMSVRPGHASPTDRRTMPVLAMIHLVSVAGSPDRRRAGRRRGRNASLADEANRQGRQVRPTSLCSTPGRPIARCREWSTARCGRGRLADGRGRHARDNVNLAGESGRHAPVSNWFALRADSRARVVDTPGSPRQLASRKQSPRTRFKLVCSEGRLADESGRHTQEPEATRKQEQSPPGARGIPRAGAVDTAEVQGIPRATTESNGVRHRLPVLTTRRAHENLSARPARCVLRRERSAPDRSSWLRKGLCRPTAIHLSVSSVAWSASCGTAVRDGWRLPSSPRRRGGRWGLAVTRLGTAPSRRPGR
jgi:hypothetical protein